MMGVRGVIDSRVASYIATLESGNPMVVAWEESRRSEKVADAIFLNLCSIAGPHLQNGPTAESVAQMILGKSPQEVSNGKLSRKEAHIWMHQAEHATPESWLWGKGKKEHEEIQKATQPDSIRVIRWLLDVLNDPLRRASAIRHRSTAFGGYEIDGSVIDRLDEIKSEDLASSVIQTLEAAVNRAIKEEWDGPDKLCEPQDNWVLPDGVSEITTFSRLYLEGKSLRHCVAQYASRIASGEGRILSVGVSKKLRATAWIVNGKVSEHRAFANSEPPKECKDLLSQARF